MHGYTGIIVDSTLFLFRCMGVGRGAGGLADPGIGNFQQKKVFLVLSGKNLISYFPPLEKFRKNALVATLDKILPTRMFRW